MPQRFTTLPPSTTTLSVTSGGNPVTTVSPGTLITLTATVATGGAAEPAGQVEFCDASSLYCTDIHLLGTSQITSAGTAVFRFLPGVGTHSYKAVFTGVSFDFPAAPSTSNVSPLLVEGTAQNPTNMMLAATGAQGDYTLTATIAGSGTAAPTGTVSFVDTSNIDPATNLPYVLGTVVLAPSVDQLRFINSSNPAAGTDPTGIVTGDFNGDGKPDIAVADDTAVAILLGNGDGTFQPAIVIPANWNLASAIVTADFNGDGNADLVAGADLNMLVEFLGNGDGTFNAKPLFYASFFPTSSVATGDFFGWGNADLAFTSPQQSGFPPPPALGLYVGYGDGLFLPWTGAMGPSSNNQGIAVADFNGDGIPDVALGTGLGGSDLSILLGEGAASFRSAGSYPAGEGPVSLVAADFNGDGNMDIAALCEFGTGNVGYVTLVRGAGDGTFTPAGTVSLPYGKFAEPASIAVGDFNGDGRPDLVISYLGSTFTTVLLGHGDGTFSAPIAVQVGRVTTQVATADFNGDGLTDFAVATGPGNFVGVYLAVANSSTATLTDVSPVGTGVHVVDAVYPGDGNYLAATSNPVDLEAERVATTLTLVATPAQGLYGRPFTLTATVAPNLAQDHKAGGTVAFSIGGNSIGVVNLSGGIATWNVAALPLGTYTLTATYSGDGNFLASTSTVQYVVLIGPPAIVFSVPNRTYGDPPFAVSASSPSAGAFTYSVVSGPATISGSTVTLTGAGTVVLQASQAANGNYESGTRDATFTVAKEAQTIAFTAPAPPVNYAAGPIALTATASSSLPVTFSILSGPAAVSGATFLPTGPGTVVIAADQAGNANYLAATEVTQTVTVNKGVPTITVAASPDPVFLQNPVILTATVSSSAASPTGSIAFSDGATAIGSATLVNGAASITVSTLPLGPNPITAAYSGDGSYAALGSPASGVNVQDFSLSIAGSPAETLQYGETSTCVLAVSPVGGAKIPSSIGFAVANAPTGYTFTFTPASLPAGSGASNVTLAIQAPKLLARKRDPGRTLAGLALLVILLPLHRARKQRNKVVGIVGPVLLLVSAIAIGGLTGCGNIIVPDVQTFTLNVTGTSGVLSHSAALPLTVQ